MDLNRFKLCLVNFVRTRKLLPKKYRSPYLEPFNVYGKSWCKNEKTKLHNEEVNLQMKRQNIRENNINKQKTRKVKST